MERCSDAFRLGFNQVLQDLPNWDVDLDGATMYGLESESRALRMVRANARPWMAVHRDQPLITNAQKAAGLTTGYFIVLPQSPQPETPVRAVVITTGVEPDPEFFHQFQRVAGQGPLFDPAALQVAPPALPGQVKDDLVGTRNPVVAIKCTIEQLYGLLQCTDVRRDIAIVSTLVTIFPWTATHAENRGMLISFEGAIREGYIDRIAPIPVVTDEDMQLLQLGIMAACLIGGYSNVHRVQEQVKKRLSAAIAKSGMEPLVDTLPTGTFDHLWGSPGNMQGPVLELLGATISCDADGTYDNTLTRAECADLATLGTDHDVGEVFIGILDQMRLVYENSHSTTIKWGVSVSPTLRRIMGNQNPKWNAEFAIVDDIRDDVLNSPFLGLTSTIADQHQVRSLPLHCLMGVLLHKKNLTTDQERTDFNDFAVASVREQVSDPADRVFCENLVDLVPTNSITTKALILSMANAQDMAGIHDAIPRDILALVERVCLKSHPDCAWSQNKLAVKAAEDARSLRTYLENNYVRSLRDIVGRKTMAAQMLQDQAARVTAITAANEASALIDTWVGGGELTAQGLFTELGLNTSNALTAIFDGFENIRRAVNNLA